MTYQLPVHGSDIGSYLRCKRAWWWSSPLGAHLEARVPRVYFTYGRVVHYALNMMYEHGADPVEAMYDWAEAEVTTLARRLGLVPETLAQEYVDLFESIGRILEHYQLWQTAEGKDAHLEFVDFEREFSVPLRSLLGARASGTLRYEGRFDGIVKMSGDPRHWVWEIKTARSIKKGQLEYLSHDLQASLYTYACRELYGDCGGVLYTFVRKKAPANPRVLQDGSFSEAKNQDTTPWWFEHKLREHYEGQPNAELSVAVWANFLETLRQNMTPFFRRLEITRSDRQLSEALRTAYNTGLEMRRLSKRFVGGQSWKSARYAFPAEPSWLDCRPKGCQFYIPCLLQLRGGDWERYLQANFAPRRAWDPELDREEKA